MKRKTMIKDHFRIFAAACVLLLALGLAGCSGSEAAEAVSGEGYDTADIYTLSASDTKTQYESVQDIVMEDGESYSVTSGGAYRIEGDQAGQILIDAQDEIVYLILENAFLHSYNGPAIYVKSAAKLVITVPSGTESVVSDTASYEGFSDARACIFSSSDLTFNGGGKLEVSGYCRDAVHTKDVLKVLDLSLTVKAKKDGLRGNDNVIIENASVDIQCEKNGIYTKREDKDDRGMAVINGGSVSIIAGKYGIRSAKDVYVNDCSADISGVAEDIMCRGDMYIQEGCLK